MFVIIGAVHCLFIFYNVSFCSCYDQVVIIKSKQKEVESFFLSAALDPQGTVWRYCVKFIQDVFQT